MSAEQSPTPDHVLDFDRLQRIGLSEAVFCAGKNPEQIDLILQSFKQRAIPCLLTRLSKEKAADLLPEHQQALDFDPLSGTAFYPAPLKTGRHGKVVIVSGGTSDAAVCHETARTLLFHGVQAELIQDVGVTGLWRLQERLAEIRGFDLVIAVAGMEGALFSVLGGLISAPLIAVPTSVGYGVAADGELSLHAALSSCAPGILSVNIDNGYGAACAALRILARWSA